MAGVGWHAGAVIYLVTFDAHVEWQLKTIANYGRYEIMEVKRLGSNVTGEERN